MTRVWAPELYQRRRPAYFSKERDEFLLNNPTIDPMILADYLSVSERFIITYQRKLGIRKLTSPSARRRRSSKE